MNKPDLLTRFEVFRKLLRTEEGTSYFDELLTVPGGIESLRFMGPSVQANDSRGLDNVFNKFVKDVCPNAFYPQLLLTPGEERASSCWMDGYGSLVLDVVRKPIKLEDVVFEFGCFRLNRIFDKGRSVHLDFLRIADVCYFQLKDPAVRQNYYLRNWYKINDLAEFIDQVKLHGILHNLAQDPNANLASDFVFRPLQAIIDGAECGCLPPLKQSETGF